MNEVTETIYQWCKGMKIQHISRSLGLDRKTVRKYLGIARRAGIEREGPLPDEHELAGRVRDVMDAQGSAYDTPGPTGTPFRFSHSRPAVLRFLALSRSSGASCSSYSSYPLLH